ncbi:MAG: sugar phosphate isomerase/epimerase family protein [Planctomycetota bacterium]|jgi:sugar phosphate isomerase/epimerase
MKPIAIQLYTFREMAAKDFPAVLRLVADIGFAGVEPAGLHGCDPAEIRNILDDLGLACPSAHMGLPTRENLNETVDTAKALGLQFVVAGAGREAFKTNETIKAAAERFQAAAEMLKPHGLRVGYHNHWWECAEVAGRLGLEIFLEQAPDVADQLDIYWASNFATNDVPAVMRRLAGRVPLLHVKDGPLAEGQPHTAVGAGKLDIPAVLAAVDQDVLQWLIVELDQCAGDMTQAVRESYRYLTTHGLAEGRK